MAKKIPATVKEEILQITSAFNEAHNTHFEFTFRGQYGYLIQVEKREVITGGFWQGIALRLGVLSADRLAKEVYITETQLGRIKYEGRMDNWSFAVYRYSKERYDPNVFFFPGRGELDGTIEGVLRAGMMIYA